MTSTPTASSLVEGFRLKKRGRERGQDGQPHTTQPTLDNVEMEVVGHCDELYARRRDEYHHHRSALEERMRPRLGDRAGDPLVENTCKDMKDAFAAERPELAGLVREAQEAIGEVNRFKRDERRTADADYPGSRFLHWGLLVALVLGESLINGLFFGANVEGGLLEGTAYAVLISVVNVVVLGGLVSFVVRQAHHRDSRRKFSALTGLATLALAALFWNLLVAHYREALLPDYPARPEGALATQAVALAQARLPAIPVAQSTGTDSGPEACWVGPEESDADQEALCLFLESPFGLNGFYSYMLLLIGLAMCAGAAADWFKTDDPYPGYGKRERRRRKAEEELLEARRELLGKLAQLHERAARTLRSDFRDPVEEQRLAVEAYAKLHTRHTELSSYARDLEKSCSSALSIYRNANREVRSTPDPQVWQTAWVADWDLPAPPGKSGLVSEAEAKQLSLEIHNALEEHEKKMRGCHDECLVLVNELTRLDLHDKAVPT